MFNNRPEKNRLGDKGNEVNRPLTQLKMANECRNEVLDPLDRFKKNYKQIVSDRVIISEKDLDNFFLSFKSFRNVLMLDGFQTKILPELATCARSNRLALNFLLKQISDEYRFHKKSGFKKIECPSNNEEINEVRILNRILLCHFQNNEFQYRGLNDISSKNNDICLLAILTRWFLLSIQKSVDKSQLKYLINLLKKNKAFLHNCLIIKIHIQYFEELEDDFWKWEESPFLDENYDFFLYSFPEADPGKHVEFLASLLRELLIKNKKFIFEDRKKKIREKIFRLDKKEKNSEYYAHADRWNNLIKGLIPVAKEEEKKRKEKQSVDALLKYLGIEDDIKQILYHESPDFIVETKGNCKIGIEVTLEDPEKNMRVRGKEPYQGFYVDVKGNSEKFREIIKEKSDNKQLKRFEGELWLLIDSTLPETIAKNLVLPPRNLKDKRIIIKNCIFSKVYFNNLGDIYELFL